MEFQQSSRSGGQIGNKEFSPKDDLRENLYITYHFSKD